MDPSKSQAVPEELVTPTGAQDPGTAPAEGSTQPDPQTEKPLTLEMVRQLAREEATRIAQSQVAKGENRIQKVIKERFDALEKTKSALGLSDDQVAQARQKIMTEAYSSPDDAQPNQQTTPSDQPADPNVDQAIQYLTRQVHNVFARVGQTVTRSDPEYAALQKAVDDNWTNPEGLTDILLAARDAAAAKTARLQTQQQTAAGRVTAAGPTPSSGQAQQPAGNTISQFEEAYRKK
jgi:hypothetical protein